MWRLLFMFSALPIIAALVVRWYFGLRILADEGKRPCRCDLATWMPLPEDSAVIHRAEESASEFGRQLRLKALADWRAQDPKAAAARENSRRFGMAVPPLSGVVAVFAVLVAKIPIMGGISCLLAATALASALGVLSLAPEIAAITRAAQKLRAAKSFPRRDDEDAVIRCAVAHAWKETMPPILALLQR
ncbi:MAG: hypothetical protein RLZZ214_2107 [Verrucomicrobiota bacterium]|jgi:hypothetical protein